MAARVEFVGETRRADENRDIMLWLRHCPSPGIVRLHIDGEPTAVNLLRAGHLDYQRSQFVFDPSVGLVKKESQNECV